MPAERKSRLKEVNALMRQGMTTGLVRAAEQMKVKLVQEMRQPKHGRIYRRVYGSHVASAPGESPATDYGLLESSIRVERESELSVAVGTSVPYASALEFGAKSIAARPMWSPISLGMSKEAAQIEAIEVRRVLK